jgi:hypothetical protein
MQCTFRVALFWILDRLRLSPSTPLCEIFMWYRLYTYVIPTGYCSDIQVIPAWYWGLIRLYCPLLHSSIHPSTLHPSPSSTPLRLLLSIAVIMSSVPALDVESLLTLPSPSCDVEFPGGVLLTAWSGQEWMALWLSRSRHSAAAIMRRGGVRIAR